MKHEKSRSEERKGFKSKGKLGMYQCGLSSESEVYMETQRNQKKTSDAYRRRNTSDDQDSETK